MCVTRGSRCRDLGPWRGLLADSLGSKWSGPEGASVAVATLSAAWVADLLLCLAASNVEHALCPPKPGYVRGFNHPCGCFCEPVPG